MLQSNPEGGSAQGFFLHTTAGTRKTWKWNIVLVFHKQMLLNLTHRLKLSCKKCFFFLLGPFGYKSGIVSNTHLRVFPFLLLLSLFLAAYPRPLARCSFMCEAPHKAAQAETLGSFLHTIPSVLPPPAPPPTPTVSFFSSPLSLTKRKGRWDLMEVIISESLVCHPSLHHHHRRRPTTFTSPSLHNPPHQPTNRPTNPPPPPLAAPRPPHDTTQSALKRQGENSLCLRPPFKQKTSSDLERPTTLSS